MLNANELIDRLAERLTTGLPVPSVVVVSVTERRGATPNWSADVAMPVPLAIAERWIGVVTALQWSAPTIDFADATETLDGAPSVSRDLSMVHRRVEDGFGGHRTAVSNRTSRAGQASNLLRWVAGVPAALAVLAAAFIAMAE